MYWQPAQFWQAEGERLLCTLCPFRCALSDGQVGLCRVRRRQGDHLETATFASSVHHWQTIERKPLYHFRPGRHTLTLAAPGCTFRCDYCQNSRISQYGRDDSVEWTALPVDSAQVVAEARAKDAMIALSYSEPTLAAELTLALAYEARETGVEIVWKSNGFVTPEALALIAPALAAVNIDLKAVDDDAHRRLTGAPVAPLLANLHAFRARGIWLEISTPLITGFNTDTASLVALAEQVYAIGAEVPWHLLRFHPDYHRLHADPTTPELLARAVAIAKDVGLRYVYVERALGARGRCTYCPQCGYEVITRDIWALRQNALHDGACPACGEIVPGKW
ncbi:MAG: AmmeMemoRadiSam system radical SAM enzyme [Deltaproteobacteria bacterium]|nr:AmmeMemoRadiSam system radical SAM enzyme [Deltaproteobacteria bacterium]